MTRWALEITWRGDRALTEYWTYATVDRVRVFRTPAAAMAYREKLRKVPAVVQFIRQIDVVPYSADERRPA